MNVDIGGGTTKVVICRDGRAVELMAMDVGARLLAFNGHGVITRVEPAARDIASLHGLRADLGEPISADDLQTMTRYMVDELIGEVSVGGTSRGSHLLRTDPLKDRSAIGRITFSGGVSEYVHGRAASGVGFGDLGPLLAQELRARSAELGARVVETPGGIRATVIGASQYTIQVSGSTIFLSPLDVVPVRNVPVVMPHFPWHQDDFEAETVTQVIRDALRRFDLLDANGPVALAAQWEGSATYGRIKAFCTDTLQAMQRRVTNDHPLILVFDNDIGGLLGLHFREEMQLALPIISIDGVELREFDFIDIGELIPSSGAVPVVIKSLIFPK
jgi:ethanolamine utilization protein EutA